VRVAALFIDCVDDCATSVAHSSSFLGWRARAARQDDARQYLLRLVASHRANRSGVRQASANARRRHCVGRRLKQSSLRTCSTAVRRHLVCSRHVLCIVVALCVTWCVACVVIANTRRALARTRAPSSRCFVPITSTWCVAISFCSLRCADVTALTPHSTGDRGDQGGDRGRAHGQDSVGERHQVARQVNTMHCTPRLCDLDAFARVV
jgi:hypothetical protein